jgi:TonB family protein
VTIEADGRVGEALMRESVNPVYDQMVVAAARQWKFKPATKDGAAVRFVKFVGVEVQSADRR